MIHNNFTNDLNCFVTDQKELPVLSKTGSLAQEKFNNTLPLNEESPAKYSITKIDNQKIENSSNEESSTTYKNLLISSISSPSVHQIKSSAIVNLPNFTSAHINEQGEVFYLTPIGGDNIHLYNDEKLDNYTKNVLQTRLKFAYDDKHRLVNGKKIIEHSLAQKIEALHAKEHTVNLWIQACHFIIVKSNLERYWFLHYDPDQSKHQNNVTNDGFIYPRPNYSDLRPILPYNLDGVAIKDDEKLQVVVVHPTTGYNIDDPNNLSNGEFDAAVFKNFVGEDKVISIKEICYKYFLNEEEDHPTEIDFKDFIGESKSDSTETIGYKDFLSEEEEQPIEIDFNTKSESLTIYLKGHRDKSVYSFEKLFSRYIVDPDLIS